MGDLKEIVLEGGKRVEIVEIEEGESDEEALKRHLEKLKKIRGK